MGRTRRSRACRRGAAVCSSTSPDLTEASGHSLAAVSSGLHRPQPQAVHAAATRLAVPCLRAGGVTWATRRRRGRRNPRSRSRRRSLSRREHDRARAARSPQTVRVALLARIRAFAGSPARRTLPRLARGVGTSGDRRCERRRPRWEAKSRGGRNRGPALGASAPPLQWRIAPVIRPEARTPCSRRSVSGEGQTDGPPIAQLALVEPSGPKASRSGHQGPSSERRPCRPPRCAGRWLSMSRSERPRI